MRLTAAVIIASGTLLIGAIFGESHLWLPLSVLVAAVIDLFTRQWAGSTKIGAWAGFTIVLKFIFLLIGLYAAVGQLACIGLIIWWIIW